MRRRDHRGDPEAPLEAPRQVDERDHERDEDGVDRALAKLAPHLGPHRLGAHDAHAVLAVLRLERARDLDGDRRRAGSLLLHLFSRLRANDVLAVAAEALNLGAMDARLIERGAELTDVRRLPKLELHQRPARELDAVVEVLDGDPDHPGDDEERGQGVRPMPQPDEIEVGPVEDAQHQMLSDWAPRVRWSHRR